MSHIQTDFNDVMFFLGFRDCGGTADWCSSTWCISSGTPNAISGQLYLTENESDDSYVLTRRYFRDEIEGADGIYRFVNSAVIDTLIHEGRNLTENGDGYSHDDLEYFDNGYAAIIAVLAGFKKELAGEK
jgi:hypothetical protein